MSKDEEILVNKIKKISLEHIHENIEQSNYPKILILHRSVDINVDKRLNEIFSERYQLSIIDYEDILLNTKLVYDVIVKKVTISQNWAGLLTTT